jgi:adenylate cyclase
MNRSRDHNSRLERLIEAMDRPLLVLAVLTMVLYLLDLRGWLGLGLTGLSVVSLAIDAIFVVDLILKLVAYGTSYVQSPWFLIDLISCLPMLDVLANGILPLRAIRFVRGLRILRVLRGLRILRALRTIPAFEQFLKEAPETRDQKRLHRYMNLGLVALTVGVLVIIVGVRKEVEGSYRQQVDAETRPGVSRSELRALGGSLEPPPHPEFYEKTIKVDGVERVAYFDLRRVEERSDEVEFFLILGMVLMMLFLMYIIAYHQLDMTQAQLRGLLNLALPKQVAERFVVDPGTYTQKSRMPATVMFMDFVGFTHICERLAHDPDELSRHLEAAMDRLVCELVKHDLIIDKFIGDAVMSFRGGPLVTGTPAEHAHRAVRAALDSTRALEALNDPYFRRVKIGGASCDDCLIGAFGTSARLSYTILGDGVNLAARLEPASAQCGTRNLFAESTHRLCDGRDDLLWRRWGRVRVLGKSAPVDVYEAFDAEEVGDPAFLDTFRRGLEAFEANDFDAARDLFLQADAQRPGGDEPSRGYADWCERLQMDGAPAGWEPVLETHK